MKKYNNSVTGHGVNSNEDERPRHFLLPNEWKDVILGYNVF
jgi:hypothetical protein